MDGWDRVAPQNNNTRLFLYVWRIPIAPLSQLEESMASFPFAFSRQCIMISKLATICLLASAWLSLAAPAAKDLQNISPGCKVKFVNVETSSTLRSYGLKDALFLPVVPSSQDKSQYFKVVQSGQSTWFIQSRVNHGFASIHDGEIVTTHEPVEWFISYAGDAAHLIKAPYDDLVWTAGQEIEYYERHILAAGANGTDSQKWYIDVECD